MGKRIIQQRRGRGGFTYRVRGKASLVRPGYPFALEGEYTVVKLIASVGHSCPLAKLRNRQGEVFYNYAANLLYVGQTVQIGGSKSGDIALLGQLANGTEVFNIEQTPRDGGKFVRTAGNVAYIAGKENGMVRVMLPSKVEKHFSEECRVSIGRLAGGGMLEKPVLKAGKMVHIMKGKSKLYPRTSPIKMNRIDHPFGSGRGKRIKSKIAKSNSPAGKKVGHLRPRRTGRTKK
jgi:large subunit ribosomal protein L2